MKDADWYGINMPEQENDKLSNTVRLQAGPPDDEIYVRRYFLEDDHRNEEVRFEGDD